MDRGNDGATPEASRRRLLAALATGGVGSVAGCEGLPAPGGPGSGTIEFVDGRPQYAVACDGRTGIEPSGLGLSFQSGELREGFEVVGTDRSRTDETWEPVWGRYPHRRALGVSLHRRSRRLVDPR